VVVVFTGRETFHPPIVDLPITKNITTGQSLHVKLTGQISVVNSISLSILASQGAVAIVSDVNDNRMNILNISDPKKPYIAGFFELPSDLIIWDAIMHGNYVYIGTNDGIKVVDISSPTTPQIIGGYSTSELVTHIGINGNRAYMVDRNSGFYILDISNPAGPKLLSYYVKLKGISKINDMVAANNYVYLTDDNDVFYIMDTSDLSNPKEVGSFSTYYGFESSFDPHIVAFNNYVFLSEAYKAPIDPVIVSHLTILDVSNPSKPLYVVSYEWCEACSIRVISYDIVYLQMENELHIVNFSNLKAPVELGYYGFPFGDPNAPWPTILGQDDYIYVLDDSNNFYVLRYTP
jgi:hypothetical protein